MRLTFEAVPATAANGGSAVIIANGAAGVIPGVLHQTLPISHCRTRGQTLLAQTQEAVAPWALAAVVLAWLTCSFTLGKRLRPSGSRSE